jgi:glycosyltransferase involved in cell wall biosynthesis
MALGKPAIVTPAGDAPVVVQHGINGYVVEFNDAPGLAERMVELARSPELRRQMGQAGREHIEAFYSLDGLAGRLLEIYSQAASLRRSRLPSPAGVILQDQSPPAR